MLERDIPRLPALLVCLIAIVAIAPLARGQEDAINPDRPGIADGSATLRRGVFEVEAGIERDDRRQAAARERDLSTPTLLRYGLTDSLEVRMESSGYQRTTSPDSTSSGWAPASIGLKAHVSQPSERTSIGIIARLFVPSGSGEFRSRTATGDLRLAADLALSERWSVNPNAGVAFNDSDGRFTSALAALTLQFNVTKTISAFADGGFQAPEQRRGSSSLLLDDGVAWVIGRNTQLDASIGWGAHGHTVPDVFWSAGLSRRW
jgi:Putative MetA-pathway of phenol degradation